MSYSADLEALKRRAMAYAKMAVRIDSEENHSLLSEAAYAVGFVSGYLCALEDVNSVGKRTVPTVGSMLRREQLRGVRARKRK